MPTFYVTHDHISSTRLTHTHVSKRRTLVHPIFLLGAQRTKDLITLVASLETDFTNDLPTLVTPLKLSLLLYFDPLLTLYDQIFRRFIPLTPITFAKEDLTLIFYEWILLVECFGAVM